MALVECPDCGKMLSEKAVVCIQCGRPMKQDIDTINSPNNPPQVGDIAIVGAVHRNTSAESESQAVAQPVYAADTYSKGLPTRWLTFYTYVILPFGILNCFIYGRLQYYLLKDVSFEITSIAFVNFMLIVVQGVFAVVLIYGLHGRRRWAWICNWVYLAYYAYNTLDHALGTSRDMIVFTGVVIISTVFVFLPNYWYFKKRQRLFK